MHIPTILFTAVISLALGAALIAGGALPAPSFAGEIRPAGSPAERQWLSIGQVNERLEAAGYRNIEKIEREHGVYEARATDRNGLRVKLHVNPQTGEVTDSRSREEHRKHEKESASGESRARDAASSTDCTKRRCRDDLQAATPATPPAAR